MKPLLLLFTFFFTACQTEPPKSNIQSDTKTSVVEKTTLSQNLIHVNGSTIQERFQPPADYQRTEVTQNTFAHYLRTLKLKPVGSKVLYHNGATKQNNGVYEAVVDLEIGKKNLHQCADAIMRLKAEYLWQQKEYDQIHFNFTNGFRVDYSNWMNGKRVLVKGNKTSWIDKTTPSNTYDDFWNYMELIFMYAGTASLEKELLPVNINQAEIGDVLIQGGHPGHAIIIVDKATNIKTGKSVYLLAQSYMPAQELQILKNRTVSKISPWYELREGTISTPEWRFESGDLRRFGA